MTFRQVTYLLFALAAWAALIAAKGVARLRTNEPYVIAWWDGSRRERGRILPSSPIQVRIALGAASPAVALAFVLGAISPRTCMYAVVGIAIAIGFTGIMAREPR